MVPGRPVEHASSGRIYISSTYADTVCLEHRRPSERIIKSPIRGLADWVRSDVLPKPANNRWLVTL